MSHEARGEMAADDCPLGLDLSIPLRALTLGGPNCHLVASPAAVRSSHCPLIV